MERKQIVVLANSFKHHGRCIAGRELRGTRPCHIGAWVRPISRFGQGELVGGEALLVGGAPVQVLRCVSMELDRHAGDPSQPENWFLHGYGKWTDVTAGYPPLPPAMLCESPPDLWLEPGGSPDSATHRWVQESPPRQSLYVIRPQEVRIRVEHRQRHEGREHRDDRDDKPRWRAIFTYHRVRYNCSITDPVFLQKYRAWPEGKTLPIECRPPCGDNCLLCVSLGTMFQGKHYKIAATIFEDVSFK